MGVVVRRAREADAGALHEVAAATFALACPPGTAADQIAAFIATHLSEARFADYLADSDRVLLLADRDGEPIGYTMLIFEEPTDPDVATAVRSRPTAELSKVYLLPGAHGTGAASMLMHSTIEEARQRGVSSVWLGVNQLNDRANRFYQKQGFATVGTKRFLLGTEVHDDFVRELTL